MEHCSLITSAALLNCTVRKIIRWQSVHETLVRVEKQLRELDDLLLLRKKFSDAEMLLKEADASLNGNVDIPKARALISSVIRLLLDEEGNDGL